MEAVELSRNAGAVFDQAMKRIRDSQPSWKSSKEIGRKYHSSWNCTCCRRPFSNSDQQWQQRYLVSGDSGTNSRVADEESEEGVAERTIVSSCNCESCYGISEGIENADAILGKYDPRLVPLRSTAMVEPLLVRATFKCSKHYRTGK